jgi:uncharacterized protein (TIGR00725 family)
MTDATEVGLGAGRRRVLGVLGPGEHATPRDVADAFEVAALAARAGWVVLTGGRDVGVMDAASRGARSADGIAIGVLPDADASAASRAVDIAIVTGLGEMRNQIVVLSSDAVVVCGMSPGTAVEVGLALRAGRRVVLLKPEPETRAFYERIGGDAVTIAMTPEEAMTSAGSTLRAEAIRGA